MIIIGYCGQKRERRIKVQVCGLNNHGSAIDHRGKRGFGEKMVNSTLNILNLSKCETFE